MAGWTLQRTLPHQSTGREGVREGIAALCSFLPRLSNGAALSHPGTASQAGSGVTYEPLPGTELQTGLPSPAAVITWHPLG